MHQSSRPRFPLRRITAALAALAFCTCVVAQTRTFEIAPGDMKSALEAYVAQSGTQLLYKSEDVRGLSTKGVKRTASVEEALQALLDGTPLKMRRDPSGAVVVFLESAGTSSGSVTAVPETQQLGTVMISANRRREPAREVPMQVDVLSADDLQRSGAKSANDYLTTQSGVDLLSEGGAGYGAISIRGVTTGTQTIPTVGVYVDDVAMGSSSAFVKGSLLFFDMGLLDLDHLELLRGPQGTLYGASAMGGLLKYVTNVPDTTALTGRASLTASATAHGGTSSTESGVINVPIQSDLAAVRVSAYHDHAGGWVDSVGPAATANVNNGDSNGGRISFLLTPNRDLTFRLTAMSQDIKREGYDFVDYNPATSRPAGGDLSHQQSVPEPYRIKTDLYSGEVEYNFGFARLDSITSYQKLDHEATIDVSSVYVPILAGAGLHLGTVAIQTPAQLSRASEELRLTSKSDTQFEWLAGLYYDHEIGGNQQFVPSTNPDGSAGPGLANVDIPSAYKEYAGFGDATWKFNRTFSVTGGLRIARNDQTYAQNTSGPLVGTTALDATSSETSKTYLLTGTYNVNDISSAYARVASGYRPGGPNAVPLDMTTHQPIAPNTTFNSDSLTNYELGYKADLLNKSVSVQGDIYDIEWRNIQQHVAVNGVSVIVNAGKARVKGAEFAVTYRPADDWSVSANGSYIDAIFTEDSPGVGAHAGDRLPDSARFGASASGNHTFTLLDRPAYVGMTYRYVGRRNAGIPGSGSAPSYVEPSYSLTDLQAGITVDRFNIALFARNIFDKRAQLSAYTALQPLGGNTLVSVAQPRTLGVTVSASF